MWRLDVSLLQAAVLVVASLPRTSRKKRAFPLMSGGAASEGGVLLPPCMRYRRSACATSRGEAPRAPSVAFCIVQGSVLPFGDAPCVCFNGRENRGRGALSPPLEKPRGAAMILHPTCLPSTAPHEERAIVGDKSAIEESRSSPFGGGGLHACV